MYDKTCMISPHYIKTGLFFQFEMETLRVVSEFQGSELIFILFLILNAGSVGQMWSHKFETLKFKSDREQCYH